MHHPEVAGVEPAARKSFLGGRLVLEVTLHYHVATEHDLAHALAIPRDGLERFGIADVESLEWHVTHALARLLGGLLGGRERIPGGAPFVHGGGTIGLRQPIKVSDVESGGLHRRQHRFRWRRRRGEELHNMRQRFLLFRGRIEQRRHYDRCATQMRHLVPGNGVVHRRRTHLAQAHMRASDHRESPGEAPAVTVEHRQCPEIDAVPAHAAGEHIADREQISAAMMIDDALGIAGGARGIIERNRVPFAVGHFPSKVGIAGGDEILILD